MAECMDHGRSVNAGSDEAEVIYCEPCEQDGRQTEAEGFCVDCSEYLCGKCYKNHKLFKAFRTHVLQDKYTMPQTVKDTYVQDLCVTKCDLHADKVIEYFCLSCDMLGCTTCITLNHRQCDKVEHIPKLVKSVNISENLQCYRDRIDYILQQVQDNKNTLDTMSAIAEDMRKVAKAELYKQRTEIRKFFDELEEVMSDKIDEIHTSNKTTLTDSASTYKNSDRDLKDLKTKLDMRQTGGQQCEAFIAMKQSARNIEIMETQLQSLTEERKIHQYELLPSPQITDMIKKVTELCRIETVTPEKQTKPNIKTSKPSTNPSDNFSETAGSAVNTADLKTLTFDTEIFANTNNDQETPYVIGVILVQQQFILVADRPNKTIKVIDKGNNKVKSELKLEKTAWSLAQIDEDKIAVGMQPGILTLSISKSGILNKESTISTRMTCFSILYTNDKFIVAEGSFVEIICKDGKVLRTIQTDSNGEQLFLSCYGIALSHDHTTIYVSDYGTDSVTSFTMEGQIKARYKDKNLQKPWGITADDKNNVYVCSTGLGNNCIHRLSPDCKQLQVFKNVKVQSIFHTNNKLLVGSHKSVRIYDIK